MDICEATKFAHFVGEITISEKIVNLELDATTKTTRLDINTCANNCRHEVI